MSKLSFPIKRFKATDHFMKNIQYTIPATAKGALPGNSFACLLLICFATSLGSCVSKKKFLAEVSNRMAVDSTLQQINLHNLELNREIAGLQINLAEKTGEARAFREIIDKQDNQIDQLDEEIRSLKSQSLNTQVTLDEALKLKQQNITDLKKVISGFQEAVTTQEEQVKNLIGQLANALNEYNSEDLSLELKDGLGYIRIAESLLFRTGSTRLSKTAPELIEQITNVIMQFPQMDITVIGHTDNQPTKSRSLKDNWDLSVLRATPVVRLMTKEFGLNPNKVIAAGKGDSKPKTSNDTAEGRTSNRRTEILIHPPTDKLLERIKAGK